MVFLVFCSKHFALLDKDALGFSQLHFSNKAEEISWMFWELGCFPFWIRKMGNLSKGKTPKPKQSASLLLQKYHATCAIFLFLRFLTAPYWKHTCWLLKSNTMPENRNFHLVCMQWTKFPSLLSSIANAMRTEEREKKEEKHLSSPCSWRSYRGVFFFVFKKKMFGSAAAAACKFFSLPPLFFPSLEKKQRGREKEIAVFLSRGGKDHL